MPPLPDALPRCVVLPVAAPDLKQPAAGLALHFLLGNVIVLHPGFQEFWFGWRVAKIFPSPESLTEYGRTGMPDPQPVYTGRREQIRFWVLGTLSGAADAWSCRLWLIDAESEKRFDSPKMTLDIEDHLTGFRKGFLQWLDRCGLPAPEDQQQKALWPEEASEAGLEAVGRALEAFYLQSAYGVGKAPVDLPPFEAAVKTAPRSFMAHDLLGWALYRNGRPGVARSAFLEAVRLNPHGAGAMAGLIWCAVKSGDRSEALNWATRKAKSCATDPGAAREKALRLLAKHGQG